MVGAETWLFWVCVALLVQGGVSCCWLQVGVTTAGALLLGVGCGGADSPASWGCDMWVHVAEPEVAAQAF